MRNDKLKDMVRSVLPSKNREAARKAKASESRRARRIARTELRRGEVEVHIEPDQSATVARRRDGDKLSHFMRWCNAITSDMTQREALDYVRSILPKNLIGDHAYFHWELFVRYRRVTYADYREHRRRKVQSFIDSTTFRLRRVLMADPDLHARLNAEIKRRKPEDGTRRLLAGVHDIENFVNAISRAPDTLAIEKAVTLQLIEQIEKTKGGRKAALRLRFPLLGGSVANHVAFQRRDVVRVSRA
ncbi:MAG TPA: hypothetical protein VJ853_10895 [Thermoanaerobaculia bacterium]|nr:hypothetical protein [Thermoanaerobaculia bacterium]